MALNKAQLTAHLTTIFSDLVGGVTPATKAAQIADAIDAYVRTATVDVTVAVTPATGLGTGTGDPEAGTGGLS